MDQPHYLKNFARKRTYVTYVLKGVVNDPVNKRYISHYECYLVAPVKNNIYHKSRMFTQRWYLFGMWHWIVTL